MDTGAPVANLASASSLGARLALARHWRKRASGKQKSSSNVNQGPRWPRGPGGVGARGRALPLARDGRRRPNKLDTHNELKLIDISARKWARWQAGQLAGRACRACRARTRLEWHATCCRGRARARTPLGPHKLTARPLLIGPALPRSRRLLNGRASCASCASWPARATCEAQLATSNF